MQQYNKSYKSYHKKYYLKNRQYFLDYRKEHYENNKDKINEKIVCECGRTIMKRYYKTHITKKIHNTAYMQDIKKKVFENTNKNIIINNNENNNNIEYNGWIHFK